MGRRLGQHFLIRESILARIARAACPDGGQTVIEIGPGKGALTKHLLDLSERVIAVEVDPVFIHYLRQKFRDHPKLQIVDSDVLRTDLGQWGPAAITGNLPYYITSPIIERVFTSARDVWTSAVFLIQKEVAERVTAGPGSRDYGYLSVQVQLFAKIEYLFTVSRAAFAPPPKVDSAVVRLLPRDIREWGIEDAGSFLRFAGLAFQQKRKMLRNNLRGRYPLIDDLPDAAKRAEQLSLEELIALYRRLVPQRP